MRRIILFSILVSLSSLAWGGRANAQDFLVGTQGYLIPAGTLLHCTLDEPNFSSATISVGDPFVCGLRSSVNEFGHTVLPRGSYLAGHLEAAKEPGHFVGKGYLRMQFDRVCLSDNCLPVPGKIIAVRGYRVDKKGEVIGHGHARRDTVEWLLPPLWPWKVVTLPARGPRATLKGEVPITLRVMDDLELPRTRASVQAPNRPPWAYRPPEPLASESSIPASFDTAQRYSSAEQQPSAARPGQTTPRIAYLPPVTPAMDDQASVPKVTTRHHSHLTLIALRSETVLAVESYRVEQGRLVFVAADGLPGALDLDKIDWRKTSQLNASPQAWSMANIQ
jgi:hypothetical protein